MSAYTSFKQVAGSSAIQSPGHLCPIIYQQVHPMCITGAVLSSYQHAATHFSLSAGASSIVMQN